MKMENVPLKEVQSTNIKEVGYYSKPGLLLIVMRNKPDVIYQYEQVPMKVFESLEQAIEENTSLGRFFVNEIKGKYKFTKVPRS